MVRIGTSLNFPYRRKYRIPVSFTVADVRAEEYIERCFLDVEGIAGRHYTERDRFREVQSWFREQGLLKNVQREGVELWKLNKAGKWAPWGDVKATGDSSASIDMTEFQAIWVRVIFQVHGDILTIRARSEDDLEIACFPDIVEGWIHIL